LQRTITRAASDPFTCYRGLGGKEKENPEAEAEEIQQRSGDDSKPSNVPLNALDPQEQSPWYLGEQEALLVIVQVVAILMLSKYLHKSQWTV
jgi:hypothetical protein